MSTAVHTLTLRQRTAAYAAICRSQARVRLVYRSNFLFGLAGLLVQVYLLRVVWTAVLPESGAVAAGGRQITLGTQIAYVTLAAVQYWLLNPWSFDQLADRIRDGKVAVDLARPVHFVGQLFFGQIGSTFVVAPFVIAALPFAVLAGGAQPPASRGAALAYLLSLFLASLITLLLSSIVSMVAFWTLEISGIFMIYRMVSQFLAGTLVPLWFMPDWLATLAQWLPFQSTTFTPVAIYLGQLGDGGDVLRSIGVQFCWLVALWAALLLIWSRALHRIVIQGG
ncbi:ABC-2 family transporter protein [Streptomyces sp. BE147]|uniref:ABC transporter permease n=1 Tax=unclassified Streptomyces TaxID=2593676 RepID=UPI002E7936B3|nr:ABC-2 family transporter protein [Streptomyces sp. BE147]MEE1736692.1 ABC-2 family transporter protein [Streptomyces sp. BE147]